MMFRLLIMIGWINLVFGLVRLTPKLCFLNHRCNWHTFVNITMACLEGEYIDVLDMNYWRYRKEIFPLDCCDSDNYDRYGSCNSPFNLYHKELLNDVLQLCNGQNGCVFVIPVADLAHACSDEDCTFENCLAYHITAEYNCTTQDIADITTPGDKKPKDAQNSMNIALAATLPVIGFLLVVILIICLYWKRNNIGLSKCREGLRRKWLGQNSQQGTHNTSNPSVISTENSNECTQPKDPDVNAEYSSIDESDGYLKPSCHSTS